MVPHNRVVLTAEDRAAVMRVLDSGQIGPGPEVEAFERELAERFRPGGAAACVSSGTAALHLAVAVYGFQFVMVPTYACSALYHAVWGTKAQPAAVCDCDLDTFGCPSAHIVVHMYGVPCHVQPGSVEDFTHAPGASLDGRPCGSLGDLSVISFGATKPLGCGSGGAVLGPPDAIEEIKDRRDYDGKRTLRERFNYAWHDMGAALGRSRLKRLDEDNYRRWEIASAYENAPASTNRTWYRYVIRVRDVPTAIAHFAAAGVETINPLEPWELLHRQLGLDPAQFPNAEAIAASTVSLPIWPGMTDEDVRRVVDALGSLS